MTDTTDTTQNASTMTKATETPASASPADGTCRAVYGITGSADPRIDVCVGGKWVALVGISTVTFNAAAMANGGNSGSPVATAGFSGIAIVPASAVD